MKSLKSYLLSHYFHLPQINKILSLVSGNNPLTHSIHFISMLLLFCDSMLKFNLFHVFTHTTTTTTTTKTLHSTVTVHCRNNFSNFSVSVSNTNHDQDESFTLSNIIKSAGLSPETSLKLSKKLKHRKYDDGPDAVIQLLRNYGFSDSQLSTLVKKHPFVLLAKPEKTLLPKLEFLLSIGVSITDLPEILIANDIFIRGSLDKNIIPRYHTIRRIVHDDKEVVSLFKRRTWYLGSDSIAPNIEVLRKLGMPQTSISQLVCYYSSLASTNHSTFVETVDSVKVMGFDPSNLNFVLALQVFVKIKKETWESKFKIFERCGWSKDVCLLVFQKYPRCMAVSEKKILNIMSFLVNDMGFTPEDIARCPAILNRSLEKTIVPRCKVIKILKSKGLIKSSLSLNAFISNTEKTFLKRYVTRFQKDLPFLLDAYKGQNSN